ncbi:MAG: ECF transporter S component [Firmicutes bacterium]|nr:ECF transporter S component [Bacillota bacterium]
MKTNTTDKTLRLVLTGLMTAVVTVCVMALPIPIPMTTGYVNLGDGIIFLSVMLLGWKYGAFAGGVGASLADILLGAAAWAPWTLVIKAGMAMILGLILKLPTKTDKTVSFREILGMILATVFMTGGYYLAEGVMYGNWMAPMVGVPWNLLQGAVGTVIASALSIALKNRRLLN